MKPRQVCAPQIHNTFSPKRRENMRSQRALVFLAGSALSLGLDV
jgi:hypothetical protein